MFNSLRYYFSQAFQSVFKNKLMVFISITTIIFCLLLLGLAIIFGVNLKYISNQLEAQFEVHAFVDLSYTQEQAKSLESKIASVPHVKTAKFSTKEEALESLRGMMDSSDALIGLEEDNPLQFSYKITLDNIRNASSVAEALKKIDGITNVSNRTDILNGITSFTSIAGHISLAGMIIFAIVAVFIISNTIRLAVMSRKREISIMKSVGATNGFIRSPFIIEGIVVGVIGGIISFIPVYFGYNGVLSWWSGIFSFGMFKLVPLSDILILLLSVFLLAGCLIGAAGSMFAVRKYLKT